jgi:hypothetical protein
MIATAPPMNAPQLNPVLVAIFDLLRCRLRVRSHEKMMGKRESSRETGER